MSLTSLHFWKWQIFVAMKYKEGVRLVTWKRPKNSLTVNVCWTVCCTNFLHWLFATLYRLDDTKPSAKPISHMVRSFELEPLRVNTQTYGEMEARIKQNTIHQPLLSWYSVIGVVVILNLITTLSRGFWKGPILIRLWISGWKKSVDFGECGRTSMLRDIRICFVVFFI